MYRSSRHTQRGSCGLFFSELAGRALWPPPRVGALPSHRRWCVGVEDAVPPHSLCSRPQWTRWVSTQNFPLCNRPNLRPRPPGPEPFDSRQHAVTLARRGPLPADSFQPLQRGRPCSRDLRWMASRTWTAWTLGSVRIGASRGPMASESRTCSTRSRSWRRSRTSRLWRPQLRFVAPRVGWVTSSRES